MLFYFAYGSNMHPEVMAERCPGARAAGMAKLDEWRFHVTARGSASILPHAGGTVHGVLWRCDPVHMHRLDLFEGVSWGNYHRRRLMVENIAGALIPAFSYVNAKRYPGRARVTYMTTAIVPGARLFGLPETYINELQGWLPERPIGEKRRRYTGSRKPVRFPR